MEVPQTEDERASVVFTGVCVAGILPVRGLTGYRMLHPVAGGAVLVWPGLGLLTTLPGQGSRGSLQFTLTWPCLPLGLPQEDACAYFLRRCTTQTLSITDSPGHGLFLWLLPWCDFGSSEMPYKLPFSLHSSQFTPLFFYRVHVLSLACL